MDNLFSIFIALSCGVVLGYMFGLSQAASITSAMSAGGAF